MSTETKQDGSCQDDEIPGRVEKKLCELCLISGDMNIANIFCETCNKLQCADCIEGHYKYPHLAGHTFTKLNSEGKELDMKDMCICKKHGNVFNFFCKDDEIVICSTCFLASHRNCKDVVEITSVASDADIKLKMVRNSFHDLGKEVIDLIEKYDEVKETMSRQVKHIPDTIAERRNGLNTRLGNTKRTLLVESNSIKSKYLSEMQDKEALCTFILEESKKCNEILTNMSERSVKERFIAKKKIEKRYKRIKDSCKGISEFEEVNTFLEFEEPFQFLEKTGSSIGTLKITQMKTDRDEKDFRSVEMRMIRSKELEKDDGEEHVPLITGIDFFPDGRLVMVDNRNRKITIIDENFDSLSTPYKLDYGPQDVVVTSHEEFAVTACVKRKIDIFCANLSSEIVFVRSISSKYQLQNIAIGENECFIVGHHKDIVPLSLISTTGEEKVIDIEWIPAQYNLDNPCFGCQYIRNCRKIVLFHPYENAIHIYDTELNTKVIVKLETRKTVATIEKGPFNSFFVCNSMENGSILQISSTGQILSDHKLGIDDALDIGISKDFKRILVSTNKSETKRMLYLVETVF